MLQAGALIVGATGIWACVGTAWQATSLSRSLKRVATDGAAPSESTLAAGTLFLPLRLSYIGHDSTCQGVAAFDRTRTGMHETVSQGLDLIISGIHAATMQLATDVQDELYDAYPEELNRTSLRDIRFARPDARARWRIKSMSVRKFAHLTSMARYERAQAYARMLPGTLRMLDYILLEHLALLHHSAYAVRSAWLSGTVATSLQPPARKTSAARRDCVRV